MPRAGSGDRKARLKSRSPPSVMALIAEVQSGSGRHVPRQGTFSLMACRHRGFHRGTGHSCSPFRANKIRDSRITPSQNLVGRSTGAQPYAVALPKKSTANNPRTMNNNAVMAGSKHQRCQRQNPGNVVSCRTRLSHSGMVVLRSGTIGRHGMTIKNRRQF
jgi:hypothetical protein